MYCSRKTVEKQALRGRINRIVIKQLKNNRKQIQMAALPWVESTEMSSLRLVEYSIENPETGMD